jgi:multicomponent Na+:H+ antiporter subunit C
MTIIQAAAVGVLLGTGSYMLLKHDLIRVVVGMLLISNGANLFIMLAGLERGPAPIYPLPPDGVVADPLVQAMTLTAIVITFGVTALLLSLIYRVYVSHATVDTDTLAAEEELEELSAEIVSRASDPEDDALILNQEGHLS